MDSQGGEDKPVINVIATVELKEGKLQEYLTLFRKYVPHVRAENGCIEYNCTVDIQTPIPIQDPVRIDRVVIVEKWADLPALYAHLEVPHMKEFFKEMNGIVEKTTLKILQHAA